MSLALQNTRYCGSMLYPTPKIPNQPKEIISRVTWNGTFSIPTECDKSDWVENQDYTKLKPNNNCKISCGGLLWNIYIHQSEHVDEFALSVFPVYNNNDKLPDNYKLNYKISTTLSGENDEKQTSKFSTEWNCTLDNDKIIDIRHIDNDEQFIINIFNNKQKLPFTNTDLNNLNNPTFNVCIQTHFIKKHNKPSFYCGILGSILIGKEYEIIEINKLKNNQDLQNQLNESNNLKNKMQDNNNMFLKQLKQLTNEIKTLSKNSVNNENIINRFQNDSIHKNNQIVELNHQIIQLEQQIQQQTLNQHNNSINQIIQLLQRDNVLSNELNEMNKQCNQLKDVLHKLKEENKNYKQKLKQKEDSINKYKIENDQLKENIKTKADVINGKMNELNNMKQEMRKKINELNGMKEQILLKNENIKQLQDKNDKLNKLGNENAKRMMQMQSDIQTMQGKNVKINELEKKLNEECIKCTNIQETYQNENKELKEKINALEQQLQQHQTQTPEIIVTSQPQLEETKVDTATGHENDELLKQFNVNTLYQQCRKNIASSTVLTFYQDKTTHKIRLVCTENITNKLILNQLVPSNKIANIDKKNEKQIGWNGFDCMLTANFADKDVAKEFYDFFIFSSQSNDQVAETIDVMDRNLDENRGNL